VRDQLPRLHPDERHPLDADKLDRGTTLTFLRATLLGCLVLRFLPEDLAFLGSTSRAETRSLVDAVDNELTLRPDVKLRVLIGGAPLD